MSENENHEVTLNCKDFLSQVGPIETLLGSVSYNDIDNVDGKTQQLRTSARVFKKMKFDLSNNATIEKKEKKEEVKPEEPKPEIKKPVNPLWISEEKKMFFEALNEHGKDFESIHMYISTRLKKKGVTDDLIKTKHQIRHFYYKTFHMLSGLLKFSDKIPKNVQELYALINYGEIRRKIGSVQKKNLQKLNVLVAKGSISLRAKGKMIKVKTPMCRALRRLNQLDEKYDDLKLPTRVLVELNPRDMVSFLRVQSMAQNPRIKVAVSLQKRLSSLITCINARWKNSEAVVYDKALISTNPTTKDCVPDQKEIDTSLRLLTPLLRLRPPTDAHVELPSIDISEYFTGQSISLTAFETRKGVKSKEEVKKEEPESKIEKLQSKVNGDESASCEVTPVNKVVDEAVSTILSLQVPDLPSSKSDNKTPQVNSNSKDIPLEEKNVKIEQIKQGWTVENCGSLTVGEIYLMFGSNSKVFLEYSWDNSQPQSQQDGADVKQENNLTNSLKKLLSLAKLQCNKTVMQCTCGHVCGASNKSNAQFKKPLATKVVKKNQAHHENTVNEIKSEETEQVNSRTVECKSNEASEEPPFHDTSTSMVHLFHQRETLQKLNPKMRNRGRIRYKQLVVERKLVPNKSESKHQIVSMNIVPQESKSSEELSNLEEPRGLLDNSGIPSLLLGDNNRLTEESGISEKNFSGLLGDNQSNSAMSTGITKILKENENQWINADVTDYSLSSLLGHLDCPSKTNQSMVSMSNDDTHLSQDVEAQLHTLLIEASVDYTAKFADLAAQVIDKK